MAKKFTDLTSLAALAADDIFPIHDDSAGVDKTVTMAVIIAYILSQELDSIRLNEDVALAATSTEIDAAATLAGALTALATEINSVCEANTATAAEIVKAADGIGVTIPRQKLITMGDWNMDSTSNISVAHGLTLAKIIGCRVLVRNDADTERRTIFGSFTNGSTTEWNATIAQIDATNVHIVRESSGIFDSANYDSTSYNRGWIILDYID
jgi:hypothetical protein